MDYRTSMKFHMALTKISEPERADILAYAIALAEEGVNKDDRLKAIKRELEMFKEPASQLSSDTQSLLKRIWSIVVE